MKISTCVLGAAAAVACSGSDSGVDRSPGVITVETGFPPALLAFRDDMHPAWQGVPVRGATAFDLVTTGTYQVAVVCQSGGPGTSFAALVYARSSDDGDAFQATCANTVAPFDVRGKMVQPGSIAFGLRGTGTTGTNWDFDVPTPPGTFDLVMLSFAASNALEKIAIRRDVAITKDVDLGTIDQRNEHPVAVVPMSLAVSNLRAGETASARVRLASGNTVAALGDFGVFRPGLNVKLAPEAALRPTDHHVVDVTALTTGNDTSPSISRTRTRTLRAGDPTAVALPDPLGSVAFSAAADGLTATWSTLPDYDELVLESEHFVFGGPRSAFYRAVLTRSFVETTGATRAALDFRDIPGFQSDWDYDPSVDEFRDFTARHRVSDSETETTTVSEFVAARGRSDGPAKSDELGDRTQDGLLGERR